MNPSSASHAPRPQNPSTLVVRRGRCSAFKRESRRKRKEKKREEKLQLLLEDWAPLAGHHRPAISPATYVSDWPLETVSNQNPEPASWNLSSRLQSPAQPQLPVSAEALAQEIALRLCRGFCSTEYSSDEEDLESSSRNDRRSYEFLKGLFDQVADLRDFYLRDWAKGEFYCLVCGGIGEKLGKKFVGLVALAQHANFISKTRMIMMHRDYGRLVCELLDLEIDGFKCVYFGDNAHDTYSQDEEAVKGPVGDTGEDCVEMNADA